MAVYNLASGLTGQCPLEVSWEIQERANEIGFDFFDIRTLLDRFEEELDELAAAETDEAEKDELGDILFLMVNFVRHHDASATAVLRAANEKFLRRWEVVEEIAAERNQLYSLRDMTFEEKGLLWAEAKERIANRDRGG